MKSIKRQTLFRIFIVILCVAVQASSQTLQNLEETDSHKQRREKTNTNFQAIKSRVDGIVAANILAGLGYIPEKPLSFSSPLTRTSDVIGIQPASGTQPGIVTTGAQTFAGAKTFNGNITAPAYFGNGAGLTGIVGATGGVANTGSTTIGADTDGNGVGEVAIQINNQNELTIQNDGETLLSLASYTKATLPSGVRAGTVARVTDDVRGLWVYTGTQWISLSGKRVEIDWFGATANDSSDDTAAVIAGYTAASTIKGEVYAGPGRYRIDTPNGIVLDKSNVVFSGAGDATVFTSDEFFAGIFYNPTGTEVHNLTFKDFLIDKEGVDGYGISLAGNARDITVRNLKFVNFTKNGVMISLQYARNILIEDNSFIGDGSGSGQGIDFQAGVSRVAIRKNFFWYLFNAISGGTQGTQQAVEEIEVTDNYADVGWFLTRARFSGEASAVYTASSISDATAAFSGIVASEYVRAMPVRRTSLGGAVTYNGNQVRDTAADFISAGSLRGDIVRAGTAFAVVKQVGAGTTKMGATASAGATVLSIESEKAFPVGAKLRVVLDNGAAHLSTVTASDFFQVTIANAIPAGRTAPAGNRVDSNYDILQVEEWLSDADRSPVAAPASGTQFTAYGVVLGIINSATPTSINVSRWYDRTGATVTVTNGTRYEVIYQTNYACHFDRLARKVTISRNRFLRTYGDMISFYGERALITDNSISDGQDVGITLHGNNNIVGYNYIEHVGSSAIWTTADDSLFIGNQAVDTQWTTTAANLGTITMWGTARSRVAHNHLENISAMPEGKRGIILISISVASGSDPASDNVIEFNTFRGFTLYDVLFDAQLGSSITGTALRQNKGTNYGYIAGTTTPTALIEQDGSGSPEGAVVGSVGSRWMDTGTGTLYIKKTGTGNTGWATFPNTGASNLWTADQWLDNNIFLKGRYLGTDYGLIGMRTDGRIGIAPAGNTPVIVGSQFGVGGVPDAPLSVIGASGFLQNWKDGTNHVFMFVQPGYAEFGTLGAADFAIDTNTARRITVGSTGGVTFNGASGNLTAEGTGTSSFAGSLQIGGGTAISKVLSASSTLDFPSTSAQSASDLTITVTGAVLGDVVALGVPHGSVSANSSFTAWVSASNTVTVRFNNFSSGAIDPASGSFRVQVTRF